MLCAGYEGDILYYPHRGLILPPGGTLPPCINHCEKQVSAPVLYRGINIDPETINVGDTIDLHDMEAFVSMSPDLHYAWNFGNVVLAVEGLEGCPITETEWLVLNTEIYIENIEYDDRNDIYIVSCR